MDATQTISSSTEAYRQTEYYGALDGFRGLLALLVAIYHTPWGSWFNGTDFMNNGTVIIDLFFVFSGFLMFRLYGDHITDAQAGKRFIWRRFGRLYPIHFVMTMVFLGFAVARIVAHKVGISVHEVGEILPFSAGAQEGWGSLVSNLTLTHAMGTQDSLTFNPPSWTISVEFFTYFVFAAMLIWAKPTKRMHFVAITAAIAGIYAALASAKPNMDITYDLAFFRCLAGFFTGVVAAHLFKPSHAPKGQGGAKSTLIEAAMLVSYIGFVALMGGKLQFLVGIFAFGFVMIFARDAGAISRVMMAPVFRYLAKISYSVYMIHVIIAIFFDILAERLLAGFWGMGWNDMGLWGDLYLIPYLLVVIGASHLTQKYIEVPGAKLIAAASKRGTAARRPLASTPQSR